MRNAKEIGCGTGKKVLLAKKRDDGEHPIDLSVTCAYAHRLAQHLPDEVGSLEERYAALGLTEETS